MPKTIATANRTISVTTDSIPTTTSAASNVTLPSVLVATPLLSLLMVLDQSSRLHTLLLRSSRPQLYRHFNNTSIVDKDPILTFAIDSLKPVEYFDSFVSAETFEKIGFETQ